MSALDTQNGIEYTVDDVSGSLLDPAMVHAGRATEMDFFNGVKVYDRGTEGGIAQDRWKDYRYQVDRREQGRHRQVGHPLQIRGQGIQNNTRRRLVCEYPSA